VCGICGIYDFSGGCPADPALLERMNASLLHRGPDGGGVHVDGPAGLAARRLAIIDLWDNQLRHVDLTKLRQSGDCRVCQHGEFAWLSGERGDASAVLCGRNAVQLSAPAGTVVSIEDLAARLAGVGKIERNAFLLRLHVNEYLLTVFSDGRTIVAGTNDVAVARSVQARYLGA
jgi:adenylyltransferase/sulfurtransferase